MGLGRAASGKISQLLDLDYASGWNATYDDRLGIVAGGQILFQHWPKIAQSTKPGGAEQAVGVEGVAELVSDRTIRKQFGELYQKKYKWDMKDFSEPIYIVRPRVAFGLFEKKFMASATRWTFE